MKTLTVNNITTLIPPWATAAPTYTYDATPTHCYRCTCDALCDYDDTRCANRCTSSTTARTKFHREAGFEDNGGLFEDAAGGHEQDNAGCGMSFYGYRYYKPDLGRWVNRDPIGERGGLNVYGFVQNDGVQLVDPLGENVIKCIVDIVMGIVQACGLCDNRNCDKLLDNLSAKRKVCDQELKSLQDSQGTLAGDVAYMDKYDASWLSQAHKNCVTQKMVEDYGKEKVKEMYAACAKELAGKYPTP